VSEIKVRTVPPASPPIRRGRSSAPAARGDGRLPRYQDKRQVIWDVAEAMNTARSHRALTSFAGSLGLPATYIPAADPALQIDVISGH
jgi:hypothetical protein